mmetsp:Transcript_83225/g.131345  ORF Transcript_83225/g.131345 Transcript_83225/m.131345 type:complete len:170 (-) Transcript_83225:282-791(-)
MVLAKGVGKPPDGCSTWAKAYETAFAEVSKFFTKTNTGDHLLESLDPVSQETESYLGVLGKRICCKGRYGRVEGLEMGAQSMLLLFRVRYEDTNLFQCFQRYEVERMMVDDEPVIEDDSATSEKLPRARQTTKEVSAKASTGKSKAKSTPKAAPKAKVKAKGKPKKTGK